MRKIFAYENVSIFLAFAIITIFAVMLVNQFLVNDTNNRNFNNFYGSDCRKMTVRSTTAEFSIDPTTLGENYVIYNVISSIDYKDYSSNSLRAVYGRGDFPIPDMLEGTFFTEEQMLSEDPLCIVGKTAIERNGVEIDGVMYYNYNGINFRVIGYCGGKKTSDLEICVFLNWGGYYSIGVGYSASYMIDSVTKNDIDLASYAFAQQLLVAQKKGLPVEVTSDEYKPIIRVIDPITKMIYYLSGIALLFMVMITAFFFMEKRLYSIAVKKLIGFSQLIISFELVLRFVIISCMGYVFGLSTLAVMNTMESFKQSELSYFSSISPTSVALSLVSIIALAVFVSIVPVSRIFKVDTGRVLK